MAVIGTGIDMVKIARVEQAVKKNPERFTGKIYTREELTYAEEKADPYPHLAARFAAKEACAKALEVGIIALGWRNIEVNRKDGPPSLRLSGRALGIAREKGVDRIFLSLSHSREYAIAQVIITGKDGGRID
ncbi:MAG: holo-ACP synthase [Halanaerobium sp.]|nr:holo-ACP synthase [Halanaerobium sp.]